MSIKRERLEPVVKKIRFHGKTLKIINAAKDILEDYNPDGNRSIYYQLAQKGIVPQGSAARVGRIIGDARDAGLIPWSWISDHHRQTDTIPMYNSITEFATIIPQRFYLDIWQNQPVYTEFLLEKETLHDRVWDVLRQYGVPLITCRGWNSKTYIYEASERYKLHQKAGRRIVVHYPSDFDPYGQHMIKVFGRRLAMIHGVYGVAINQVALTREQAVAMNIEWLPTKLPKQKWQFVIEHRKQYGNQSTAELDAIPPDKLREMIKEAVEDTLDMDAWNKVQCRERAAQAKIRKTLAALK